MSGSTCFFYASGQCVIFSSNEPTVYRPDSTRIQPGDVWIDVNNGMIRTYRILNPPGYTGWQPMGVIGDSSGDPVNFDQNVAFDLIDLQAVATAYPHLCFKSLDATLTTTEPKYTIVMNNGILYFRLGSITGPDVMYLDAAGNVNMTGNLTVVGDLFADDVSYDVNQCNTLKVADDIVHVGNETNKIAFTTDKMTLDASGTSIVLDDAAMSDKIVLTGQTKFINNIDDVPDIYLQNHVHHSGDVNTRMGFPANDQIGLRTGGTDRVLITDTETTIGPKIVIATGAPKLQAPMSGAPESTRFQIQNSITNGNSRVYITPNGTGTIAAIQFSNNSDLDAANQQRCDIGMVGGEFRCSAAIVGTDPMPAFYWRTGSNIKMRMGDVDVGTTGQEVLSFGQDVTGNYATGVPYKGVLVNQLHNIAWADITAGYTTGSYVTMFRRANSASLILAHGYRREDAPTGAGELQSSTSNTSGRGAVEVGPAYINFLMNDSTTTPIGTQITPNLVFRVTPGRQQMSSYDQTIKYHNIVSRRVTNNGNNVAVPILQISKGADTGGSSYSTFTGIINFSGYMRTTAAVVAVLNYTAKIHIYLTAGNAIAVNIQDVSTTFSSNNSGQLIQTGVTFSGTGNTNTAYTLNFAIPYTITVGSVSESGFTLSMDGHAQALTAGEMMTFTDL